MGEEQNYIVIETQTTGAVTAIVTPQTFTDYEQALHVFLMSEAAAVISTVPIHSVFMLTADGRLIKSACYRHEVSA